VHLALFLALSLSPGSFLAGGMSVEMAGGAGSQGLWYN